MAPAPQEILAKAKEIVNTPGRWRKGKLGELNGQVCVLGALNEAAGIPWSDWAYPVEDGIDQPGLPEEFVEAGKALAQCAAGIRAEIREIKPPVEPSDYEVYALNDDHGLDAVNKALDCAIQRVGSK